MHFQKFAQWTAEKTGTSGAFFCALLIFVMWLVTGPYFGWSDTHHRWLDLIISVTPFWMVFILQATQNRDSDIVEAKLDELLKALQGAHEDLIGIQHHPEEKIDHKP